MTTGLAVRWKISATGEYTARIAVSCSTFACLFSRRSDSHQSLVYKHLVLSWLRALFRPA